MEKPNCKPDEVLIQVSYACISGSDQHIFKRDFQPRTQEGFEMLETSPEEQLKILLDLRD